MLKIVIDVRREFSWIWGYVIGIKLVIVGGVLLIRGVVGLIENRAKKGNPDLPPSAATAPWSGTGMG